MLGVGLVLIGILGTLVIVVLLSFHFAEELNGLDKAALTRLITPDVAPEIPTDHKCVFGVAMDSVSRGKDLFSTGKPRDWVIQEASCMRCSMIRRRVAELRWTPWVLWEDEGETNGAHSKKDNS